VKDSGNKGILYAYLMFAHSLQKNYEENKRNYKEKEQNYFETKKYFVLDLGKDNTSNFLVFVYATER